MSGELLSVEGLTVAFDQPVVRGVSFDVEPGIVTALVGESGSGKTVSCLSSLGLEPHGAATTGRIRFKGRDRSDLGSEGMRAMRRREAGFVFQDPRAHLDPSMRVGEQVSRAVRLGLGASKAEAKAQAMALLESVELDAERVYAAYPHELSGGMCQRAFIALSISCGPALLVADEPTTALDASVQRSVLDLLIGFVRKRGMGMVLVTHDLRAVAYAADRVHVMLAGLVMESGSCDAVLAEPSHPYTRLLVDALPDKDFMARKAARGAARLSGPSANGSRGTPAGGCPFIGRCSIAGPACAEGIPKLMSAGRGTALRCVNGGLVR